MQDRQEEVDRLRAEAEGFLEPIFPLLDAWQAKLEPQGVRLKHQLLVGPYPFDAPEHPIQARFVVLVQGKELLSGASVYPVNSYILSELDWLAATIEFDIEERLEPPSFGRLPESVKDISFKLVQYDRKDDHDHCYSCMETIGPGLFDAAGEMIEEASTAHIAQHPDFDHQEIWLCQRCFDYWAPLRVLTASNP